MGWLSKVGGFLFGTGGGVNVVSKSLDLASEYIEDPDKRNDLAVRVIEANIASNNAQTIPWVDALHKMGRQLMMFALMFMYYYSWKSGNPMPFEDLALLAAGPGVYTLLKGKGK